MRSALVRTGVGLIAAAGALAAASCDETIVTVAPVTDVLVTGGPFDVDLPVVTVGETRTLTVRVSSFSATAYWPDLPGRTVAWSSSNTAIATVSQAGVVTGVAPGTVTIMATCEGKTGSASVTVASRGVPGLGQGFGPDQFVLVQPGTFQMGSATGDAEERPVHTVKITKAFYLQKTEVTQGQWKAVMDANPRYYKPTGDTYPAEGVSWDDAQAFVQRLNAAYPGASYRLPTEAEWEYAARAGTGGNYGGSGIAEDMGWLANTAGGQTRPVSGKPSNGWGLYDTHGNVAEWVQDWFSATYYASSLTDDPTGPTTGATRVLRGGSWRTYPGWARSASRSYSDPSVRGVGFGFRLARTP